MDHVSLCKPGIQPVPDKLYVISVLVNTNRYRALYQNYQAFEKRVQDAGGILYTVEAAFGNRPYEVTCSDNPRHLQLRTSHQLWHKETMINLGIQLLPPEAKYIAWIDADITFARPDWVQETIQQLQHYDVVQMFSHAQDVGPDFQPLNHVEGFMYQYVSSHALLDDPDSPALRVSDKPGKGVTCDYDIDSGKPKYKRGHPGYAWAARKDSLDKLGCLIDFAILGSGDHYMARALIGEMGSILNRKFSESYKHKLLIWQDRAERLIRRNVGFVPGLVLHSWHGKKKNRFYLDRNNLLVRTQFDPDLDIKRDNQGMWQLTERSHELRDGLRLYSTLRNEDSIDL